ncbi:hypothetical protein PC113_g10420 [Phytophthora cactorum]|uniref:Uncharacterized protein n=1 Tax=Phytophthora cactorum TaxID=29920 RepID=A0A8T0Z652_9STRA|nr:hypothetical protein PC113_g10420 [Phytophthora cactorum]
MDRLIRDFPSGDMKTRELKCVGWRATRGCSPNGPRDPEKDENCTQIIPRGESGYCEVDDTDSGERFRVMRRHCNSLIHTEALKPSFQLPNMNEARRDGVVMVVYPKLLAKTLLRRFALESTQFSPDA